MEFDRVSNKTCGFFIEHHRSRPGFGGYRHGFQFQRGVCDGKIPRLLLFPQASGSLVSAGNRSSARHQKYGLPQVAPAHVPHNAGNFPAFAGSDVSRGEQRSRWSAEMADFRRIYFSAFGVGKIHPCSFYCEVSGQKGRQVEELCLRLPPQPDCAGILFHPDSVSARFWHRHDHMPGHFHNAFYCRPEKKVSVFFRTCADSFHRIGHHERRVSYPENHRFSGPLARPIEHRVSSHTIFLRFWAGRLLGDRVGSQPSKTFLPTRSSHGFHLLRYRGRTGVHGNNGNHSPVFNFDLAGFRHRLPGQRSIWNPFSLRPDHFDRVSGFHQSGSSRGASSHQRIDPSLHQHGRVIHVNHNAFSGCSAEHFGTNGKTLIQCKKKLS